MNSQLDIDLVKPTLELWISSREDPAQMRCVGTLDGRTRRAFLEAATQVLADHPKVLVVDLNCASIVDASGATALTILKRMARQADIEIIWRGFDAHG